MVLILFTKCNIVALDLPVRYNLAKVSKNHDLLRLEPLLRY